MAVDDELEEVEVGGAQAMTEAEFSPQQSQWDEVGEKADVEEAQEEVLSEVMRKRKKEGEGGEDHEDCEGYEGNDV
eukprot:4277309-Pleurochrysis_carterae.AAC.2